MNFHHWPWHHWAALRGGDEALILEGQVLDWTTLCQRVDALAGGFHQQGVKTGDGVALRGKNSTQILLAWMALLQCGARVLPLNPQFPEAFLDDLLPGLTLSWGISLPDEKPVSDLPVLQWITATSRQACWQPDRLASMTLTSGSSGIPKAAVHTCAAHLASAAAVLSALSYGAKDSWLLSLPLFHVSGQGIFWRWLQAGGRLVVKPDLALADALQGCTHASLVPTQLWRLLEQKQPFTLREVLLGGATIPVALTQQATAAGLACWCGYGLTELASTVCAKPADGLPDVGTALPGHQLRIVDGEIWLRSATLASGYWREGELVSLCNAEGWFPTRDLGVLNGDRLQIIGRADNLFFSGGEGIQPEIVEQIISRHPSVEQIFIVPMADVEFGQRPVAIVAARGEIDFQEVNLWLNDKLLRFQIPVSWYILPDEFKQEGIKVSRKKLVSWVAHRHLLS